MFRYFLSDPFYVVLYGLAYFKKKFYLKINFYSRESLGQELLTGKSVIRLGDGEMGILHGKDISYEAYNKELKKKLIDIIKNYKKDSKYILSIPLFIKDTNRQLRNKNILHYWLPFKVEFKRRFNKKLKYANAHTFYIKSFFENYLASYLKDKYIIVLTTGSNIKKLEPEFCKRFKNIYFLEAKEPNPFQWYKKNKKEIIEIIERNVNVVKKDFVILISAGPAGKILAYDFSNLGYQSLDIGKGIEQIYNDKNLEKDFDIRG